MKKILLLLLIAPVLGFAQVSLEVTYKQVTEGNKFYQGKFATVSPSAVIEKDGTAAELYSSTMNWINETYKSPEDVIKGNIENKYIKINGFTSSLFSASALGSKFYYDARYTIEFRFKDSKFKVDIINLEQYTPPSQYVKGGWSNFSLPMVFKVENRKGKAYKDGITNLEAVTLHFNNLLSSLKDYSISSVGSDDFDF
jgi:hypothetical protein